MSTPLRIGRAAAGDPFELPVDLVTQTLAILGIRSSGKTVTATVIVEEALARGFQVVVVDPTDVWFGLKSSADGERPGFPVVVMGGAHGDLPLSAEAGAAVADFVVESRVPVILSLRHLRKNEQRRFVTDFAEQLYFRKGEPEHRTPLLVVIDEASQFVPQRVQGDVSRLVGAVENLVRQGRASGFGVALVDQRPASVNKDVLTQLEVLVAHRITAPQDRKALREWIDQHDTEGHRERFLEVLASLPTGRAWFWSPYLDVFELVQVRMRETFDSSRTPKPGEAPPVPTTLAEVDLDAIGAQLEAAIAEAKANDPKALKRRIQELEEELRAARRGAPAPADPEAVDRAVREAVSRAEAEAAGRIRSLEAALCAVVRDVDQAVELLGRARDHARTSVDGVGASSAGGKADILGTSGRSSAAEGTKRRPRSSARSETSSAALSGPQQRILDVLAALEPIGLTTPDRSTVAVLADQSPRSSGFANNLGRLRSQGLIDYPAGGKVALTPEGRGIAQPADPITSLAELHEAWFTRARLSAPQRRILEVLIKLYPESIDREVLAEATDQSPTSSGYANNLGFLRNSLGLIDYPAPGQVVATELLFPEGLL